MYIDWQPAHENPCSNKQVSC